MRVTVKLFAVLREKAGRSDVRLQLPGDATVAAARDALAAAAPALREHLGRCAFAVNQTYVTANTTLRDGDELAVLPPVSGG
jgi:molybdopterin converting factor subunit 1